MRTKNITKLNTSGHSQCKPEQSGLPQHNADVDLQLIDLEEKYIDTMGNNSSNRRENVIFGTRGPNVVTLRRQTDYPSGSRGRWSGNVYVIEGRDGQTMYSSQPVSDNEQRRLGEGSICIRGPQATITFSNGHGVDLPAYFQN